MNKMQAAKFQYFWIYSFVKYYSEKKGRIIKSIKIIKIEPNITCIKYLVFRYCAKENSVVIISNKEIMINNLK